MQWLCANGIWVGWVFAIGGGGGGGEVDCIYCTQWE